MKTLFAILCLLLSACGQSQPADIAIRATTVVDVTDGSLHPDQTVLIRRNRIMAVGPTVQLRVPEGADVVDAAGGYLIPGLGSGGRRGGRAARAPSHCRSGEPHRRTSRIRPRCTDRRHAGRRASSGGLAARRRRTLH